MGGQLTQSGARMRNESPGRGERAGAGICERGGERGASSHILVVNLTLGALNVNLMASVNLPPL